MKLKEKLKQLPTSPGVYLMKDSSNHVLYVGKSKNLQSRVKSYFQQSKHHSEKVKKLVQHLKDFDIIQTDTEFEALMLECRLIKEMKPLYNRMMKSPKSYCYIVIRTDKELPTIEVAQERNKEDSHLYFGTFKGRRVLEKTIQQLKEFYKIACNHPNGDGPCFNYSLGFCMGTCFDQHVQQQYKDVMARVIAFLEGKNNHILNDVQQSMRSASEQFDFEQAAKLRDLYEGLKRLQVKEKVINFIQENKNYIVLEEYEKGKYKLFLLKRNRILFSKTLSWKELHDLNMLPLLQTNFLDKSSINAEITKEELDEAHIIHHFVTEAEYVLVVPDCWLEAGYQGEAHDNIQKFIDSISVKTPTNA